MKFVAFVLAFLGLIDSLCKTTLHESRMPPARANRLIWQTIISFVMVIIFGLASFARGEELKEFASAQTMKAAGPNWTKTKVFEKLGERLIIPEEIRSHRRGCAVTED